MLQKLQTNFEKPSQKCDIMAAKVGQGRGAASMKGKTLNKWLNTRILICLLFASKKSKYEMDDTEKEMVLFLCNCMRSYCCFLIAKEIKKKGGTKRHLCICLIFYI